jgi:hypothetical protein
MRLIRRERNVRVMGIEEAFAAVILDVDFARDGSTGS